MPALRIHSILERSFVNGAGERMVIWTQGCTKACKGCFNPTTWRHAGGEMVETSELAERVKLVNPEGLTLTGGDPLEQAEALLHFLRELHEDDDSLAILPKGIICFTGYTIEEIENSGSHPKKSCLDYIDLLIDGRYVENLKHVNGLSGSSNQRFHFSSKNGRGKVRVPEETVVDQSVEFHLDREGIIHVTGFPEVDRETQKKLRDLGIKGL